MYFEPFAALNRWDYFKSRVTFFEETKPSFIVKQEVFGGGAVGIPLGFKSRLIADYKRFEQECQYYLTDDFSQGDTADLTRYIGNTGARHLKEIL